MTEFLSFSPLLVCVILLREVGGVPGHETLGALELVQAKNGDGGDEERECASLYDWKTTSQDDLEQGDEAGDKQERGDDVASGGVILPDAEERAQDEGNGDGRPEHGEIVLQPQHAASVPAAMQHRQ